MATTQNLLAQYNKNDPYKKRQTINTQANNVNKFATTSYANMYDALYDKFSKYDNFNINMWRDALKKGEQDQYFAFLEQNKGKTLSNQFYDPQYYDYETMMLEMYLPFADATNTDQVRTTEIVDPMTGKIIEQEIGAMSDKAYIQYQLEESYKRRAEEITRTLEQERKDTLGWWGQFGHDWLATGGELGEGVLGALAGITDTGIALGTFGLGSYAAAGFEGNYLDAFVDYFGENGLLAAEKRTVRVALDEYERTHTHFRDIDGNITNVGKYVAGISNSIGMMVPSIIATVATSGAASLSWLGSATFYSSVFANNMYDVANNPDLKDSPAIVKITNSAVKTAVEYVIEYGLGRVLGPSLQNMAIGIGRNTAMKGLGKTFNVWTGAKHLGKSALQEGLEEFLQDFSTNCVDQFMALYDEGYGNTGVNIQTLIDSFCIGALSSLVMSGGQIGISEAKGAVVNKVAKKKGLYNEALKYGPGDIVVETKDGVKKLHGANRLYFSELLSDFREAIDILKNDKLSVNKNIALAKEVYGGITALSQFYASFDKQRIKNCELLLDRVVKAERLNANMGYESAKVTREMTREVVHAESDVFVTEAESIFKSMLGDVGSRKYLGKISKAAKEVAKIAGANGVTTIKDGLDKNLNRYKKDPDIADLEERIGKQAADRFEELAKGYEWAFTTDGHIAAEADGVLFVSEAWLQNYEISDIYKYLEQTRVLEAITTDKTIAPMIKKLVAFDKEFSKRDDITAERAVMDLLFNETVYEVFLLSNAGKNVHEYKNFIFQLHEIIKDLANRSKYQQQQFKGKQSQARINLLNKIYEQIKNTMRKPTIKAILNWSFDPQAIGADSVLNDADRQFINAYKQRQRILNGTDTNRSAYENLAEDIIANADFNNEELALVRKSLDGTATTDEDTEARALLDEADRRMTRYDFEVSPKASLAESYAQRFANEYAHLLTGGDVDVQLYISLLQNMRESTSVWYDYRIKHTPGYIQAAIAWENNFDEFAYSIDTIDKLNKLTFEDLKPYLETGVKFYQRAAAELAGKGRSYVRGLGTFTIPYKAAVMAMNEGDIAATQFVADKLDEFKNIYGISARQMITGDLSGMSMTERNRLTQDMEVLEVDNIAFFVIKKLEGMLGGKYVVTPTRKQINASHSLGYDIKSVQSQADALSESKNISIYNSLIDSIQSIIDGIDSQKKLFMPESLTEMLEQWYKPFDAVRQYDSVTFNGKPFWCGSVSLLDGVIEEVHTYEEAQSTDFHHSMFFSEEQLEKMQDGDNAFFWVDNGKVQGDWRDRIPAEIIDKIREQIVPRKVTTTVDYQLKNLKSKIQIGLDFLTAFSEYVESNLLASNIVDFVIAKSIPAEHFISQDILNEDIETRNKIFRKIFTSVDVQNRRMFRAKIADALKQKVFKDDRAELEYLSQLSDWDIDNWLDALITHNNGTAAIIHPLTGELLIDTPMGDLFAEIRNKMRTSQRIVPLSMFIDISAFPLIDLEKVKVFFMDAGPDTAGWAAGNRITIDPRRCDDYFGTLVHEINHIMQTKYNLPGGFNDETALAMPDFLAYVVNHYPNYIKYTLYRDGYDDDIEMIYGEDGNAHITEKDIRHMPSYLKDLIAHCGYMLVQGELWARGYDHNGKMVHGFIEIWQGLGQTYLLAPDGKTKFEVRYTKKSSSSASAAPKTTETLAGSALDVAVQKLFALKMRQEYEGFKSTSRDTYHSYLTKNSAASLTRQISNPNLSVMERAFVRLSDIIRNPQQYLAPEILAKCNGDFYEGNVFYRVKEYIEANFEGISIDLTERQEYIFVDDDAFDDLLLPSVAGKVDSSDTSIVNKYKVGEHIPLTDFYSQKELARLGINPSVYVMIKPGNGTETAFDYAHRSGAIIMDAKSTMTDADFLNELNHEFRHLLQYYNGFATGFTPDFKVTKELRDDVKKHLPELFKNTEIVKWAKEVAARKNVSNYEDLIVQRYVYYASSGELNAYAFNAEELYAKPTFASMEGGESTIYLSWYDAKTGEGRHKTKFLAMRAAPKDLVTKTEKAKTGLSPQEIPHLEGKKPKDTRPRAFSHKKAKGTNLEYFEKKGTRNQLHPALQDFVIATTGHEDKLPKALMNAIYKGVLTKRSFDEWFRNVKSMNDFTFNLINKYVFKNNFITSMAELDNLLVYDPQYYWGAVKVLYQKGLPLKSIVAENDVKKFTEFVKSLENSKWEEAIIEASKNFSVYETGTDNNGNAIIEEINADEKTRRYMRVLAMDYFDGTLAGAFYMANAYRKTVLSRELENRAKISKSLEAKIGDDNSDDKDMSFGDLISNEDAVFDEDSRAVGNDIIAFYELYHQDTQDGEEILVHAKYMYEVDKLVDSLTMSDRAKQDIRKKLSNPDELKTKYTELKRKENRTEQENTRLKNYNFILSKYKQIMEAIPSFREGIGKLQPEEIIARATELAIATTTGLPVNDKIFDLSVQFHKEESISVSAQVENTTDKLSKDRDRVQRRIKNTSNRLLKYVKQGVVRFEDLPLEVQEMYTLVPLVEKPTKVSDYEIKLRDEAYKVGRGRATLPGTTDTGRAFYEPKRNLGDTTEAFRHSTDKILENEVILKTALTTITGIIADKKRADALAEKALKSVERENTRLRNKIAKGLSAEEVKRNHNLKTTEVVVATKPKKSKISDTPNNFTIVSGMDMPSTLKEIFDTSFTEMADTRVQFASKDEAGNLYDKETMGDKFESRVKHEVSNWDAFYEANRTALLALTRNEVLDITEFFERGMTTIDGPANKLRAFEIFLLGYFVDAARHNHNNWDLSVREIEHLEALFERKASELGSGLNAVSQMQKVIDPLKRVKQRMFSDWTTVSDADKEALISAFNALQRETDPARRKERASDIDARLKEMRVQEAKAQIKAKPWTKEWFARLWDKVKSFRYFAMLSGPATAVRNQVSNVMTWTLNKSADVIAKLVFLPKGYRKEQWEISKVKVSDDVKAFIDAEVKKNPLFKPLYNMSGKYDERQQKQLKNGQDLFVSLVASRIQEQYAAGRRFDTKVMNGLNALVNKAMSDGLFVRGSTLSYFGKILTIEVKKGNVDLSNGLSNEVLNLFADAAIAANQEYMHKRSVVADVFDSLREKHPAAYEALSLWLPFVNSSFNWFVEGLKYTPVGLAGSIIRMCKLEQQINKIDARRGAKELVANSRMTEYFIRRDIGKGILGLILTGLGMMLVRFGLLRLEEDDDKFYIVTGDVRTDISDIFGTSSLLVGASIAQVWMENTDDDEEMMSFEDWLTLATEYTFQDFFVNDILDRHKWNGSVYDKMLTETESFLRSFVPQFIQTCIACTNNEKIRYSSGFKGTWERWLNSWVVTQPAGHRKVNPYTGEIETEYARPLWGELLKKGILGPKIYWYEIDETERMCRELGVDKNELTGELTANNKKYTVDREKLNLKYGALNKESLGKIKSQKHTVEMPDGSFSTLSWDKLSDDQRARVIKKTMTQNAEIAKIYIWTQEMNRKIYVSDSMWQKLRLLGITQNVYKGDKGFVE